MVANMRSKTVDGFCVGEPWNVRAIMDGVGYTVATSQQIWKNHPEKVLGMTREFAEKNPKTVKALLMALLEACQYIDKMENRPLVAQVLSQKDYVTVPLNVILERLQGKLDNSKEGRVGEDPDHIKFYRDGQVTFPWKSHGIWFLTQFQRWGFIKKPMDYKKVADSVNRTDIYREAAKALGIPVPMEETKKETLFDGVEFDPADPEGYVKKFAIRRG
jgi:nitrate/nitrite transport system substrate-binding protein